MPHERHQRTQQGVLSAADMLRDIKALNSSVLILSQKMNYLVRNEKILGQNLIVLNKKLRDLELRLSGGAISAAPSGDGSFSAGTEGLRDEIAALEEKINSTSQTVLELKEKIESISASHVSTEQLKELKYLVENINPLDLVTIEQVKELIAKELKKKK